MSINRKNADRLSRVLDNYISVPTSYNLLSGSLALANSVTGTGFGTTLYTGNGTTQSINTGVDMATQWGNSATETFGGLVWIKNRNGTYDNNLLDTVRGAGKAVWTNLTAVEYDYGTTNLTSFNNNGFSVGSGGVQVNTNASTYASWVFQTTHRITGTTNHGQAYECHYNPFTGFTIVKYTGSGIAGHKIPHHLGRKLGFVTVKNLSVTGDWVVGTGNGVDNLYMNLTSANATTNSAIFWGNTSGTDDIITLGSDARVNGSTNQHIIYGWANSYYDESNKLIGNYEIGVYQGTGAADNKVTTRGKPAWVMIKRLDVATEWYIHDNLRGADFDNWLDPNLSNAEASGENIDVTTDGFVCTSGGGAHNASGGQFLYMVVYDNDSGSGKSKYPRATDTSTLNLNATIPFANGIDTNGTKNSIITKNETVSGLTLTQGKNYIYAKNDGTYGVSSIAPKYSNVNPASGDFYNVLENKWYTSSGVVITESRNYLNAIVYADQNGQPTYVEQLPKTTYFDEVKANEFKGKNACTAWVNFDGTTTPPTIRDSYNVKAVIRTATGIYDIYFEKPMDNTNISVAGTIMALSTNLNSLSLNTLPTLSKITILCSNSSSTAINDNYTSVQIFGGKNV